MKITSLENLELKQEIFAWIDRRSTFSDAFQAVEDQDARLLCTRIAILAEKGGLLDMEMKEVKESEGRDLEGLELKVGKIRATAKLPKEQLEKLDAWEASQRQLIPGFA